MENELKIVRFYNGQIIKNIREVCEILGMNYSASGSCMRIIIRELDRYCEYHKDGHKFVIDMVYSTVKPPKEDMRKYTSGNNAGYRKYYDGYTIGAEEDGLKGVYAIVLNDQIYIGSTYTTFRKRFSSHKSGSCNQRHTKDMLDNGGTFQILWSSDVDDEYIIREVEQMYIDYLMTNPSLTLVNRREETVCVSERTKYKNKIIKVDERQYELAIRILTENGIMIGGVRNE